MSAARPPSRPGLRSDVQSAAAGSTAITGARGIVAIIAMVVLTFAAVHAAAPRLAALASRATLAPPDDRRVVLDREVSDEFGFRNPVLWVIEARRGTVWTPSMLQRLAALTDEVRRVPGVIALDVIGLASPNMRDLRVTDEGLEPTYLMNEVPTTTAAVAALRQRIDTDPSYAGTLVSRDGRAAMVAANFRDDVDARAVGAAALALRDRYRDAETAVWVVGAPVLMVLARAALVDSAVVALVLALAGVVVFCAALGARPAAAALLAAALGTAWIVAGAAFAGGALPWALEAGVPGALLAACLGAGLGRPLAAGMVLAAGAAAGAFLAGSPARVFWVATGAGAFLAAAGGALVRAVFSPAPRPFAHDRRVRLLAVVATVAALLGTAWVRCSLGLAGYGERYLPPAAAADLRAVFELLPPPVSLAARVRGEPGFLTAPDVLRAFDGVMAEVRTDPAVRRAMSIADVVKMVHRAFNDGRAEFFAIPDDRALVGRYLALAYSPAFRRFVDRSFADTALWVELHGEQPADVARVLSTMRAAFASRPLPGATVDLPAGDGAVLLAMARVARHVAAAAALAVLITAGAIAATGGWRAGLRAIAAGFLTAAVAAGVLGWAGHAVDLVSLPVLAGIVLAAATAGGATAPAPALPRFGLALAAVGALALAAPLPAAPLVAALLLGPGLALLVCAARENGVPS